MVHSRQPHRAHFGGFTLIELMIAVVVVALLAAVALPSFFDSIRKSRRAEAMNAIAAVQQAQERFRSNNASYAAALTDIGVASATTTPNGYYTLNLIVEEATAATTYIVSATAVASTSQASDGACARMASRISGGQIFYASCASCETFAFAETDRCWTR